MLNRQSVLKLVSSSSHKESHVNIVKQLKKISRSQFIKLDLRTRVKKSKRQYSRKKKHKLKE